MVGKIDQNNKVLIKIHEALKNNTIEEALNIIRFVVLFYEDMAEQIGPENTQKLKLEEVLGIES